MTKTLPVISRGEIPVKLELTVEESAFREPVITKEVVISDWRDGIDLADVEFRSHFITPDEAEQIKRSRLEKMQEILRANGYAVQKDEEVEDDKAGGN